MRAHGRRTVKPRGRGVISTDSAGPVGQTEAATSPRRNVRLTSSALVSAEYCPRTTQGPKLGQQNTTQQRQHFRWKIGRRQQRRPLTWTVPARPRDVRTAVCVRRQGQAAPTRPTARPPASRATTADRPLQMNLLPRPAHRLPTLYPSGRCPRHSARVRLRMATNRLRRRGRP